jgi:hypothetical protein
MGEKLQRFILVLRKLGILRYGTKSYKYTSGKDMPAEALLDDVYDADKDLVTLNEVKGLLKGEGFKQGEAAYCYQCGEELEKSAAFCTQCGATTNTTEV